MGMYDSAYIEVKCPECGKIEVMECQTKDTDCLLDVWKEGDLVSERLNSIWCVTNCGRNHFFDLVIYLDNGRLTNRYKIIDRE